MIRDLTADDQWMHGTLQVYLTPTTRALVNLARTVARSPPNHCEPNCTLDDLKEAGILEPLAAEAFERFGKGRLSCCVSGSSGKASSRLYAIEWAFGNTLVQADPAALADALDFVDRHKKEKESFYGKHAVVLYLHNNGGSWTVQGTEQALPFQESDHYEDGNMFGCFARVMFVSPANTILVTARFPFEEADDAFFAYYDSLSKVLGYNLPKKRLRLARVNKKGDAYYERKLS
jgi:hypothetical protein